MNDIELKKYISDLRDTSKDLRSDIVVFVAEQNPSKSYYDMMSLIYDITQDGVIDDNKKIFKILRRWIKKPQ